MKKQIRYIGAFLLIMALLLSLPAAGAGAADEANHEHSWVASNFSGIRTCSVCGRQLRDIEGDTLSYAVPSGWMRYKGAAATLWFVDTGAIEEGTVYVYSLNYTEKKTDVLYLIDLAESKASGKMTKESFSSVDGRQAYCAEYSDGEKRSCAVAFADADSRKSWVFLGEAEEPYYESFLETFQELIDSIYFAGDEAPFSALENSQIASEEIEVREDYLYESDYGLYAVAILCNHSEVTADILAGFSALDKEGNQVETGYAIVCSVAPGEEVAVKSGKFSNPASVTGINTEVFAEPSVYYESLGDKSGFHGKVSDLGRSQLLAVENNTDLTVVYAEAQFLYFTEGNLSYVDTCPFVYESDPLYPGEKTSVQSWVFSGNEGYDEVRCYFSAYGKVLDQPVSESPVEIIGEYILTSERSADHYLVVRNNSGSDCVLTTDTVVYDASGEILGHTTNYSEYIPAGDTVLITEYVSKRGAERFDTSLDIDFRKTDRISQRNFDISETAIPGGLVISVTNKGSVEAGKVWIKALFFKDGELIACEEQEITDNTTALAPGEVITKALLPNLEFDSYQLFLGAGA